MRNGLTLSRLPTLVFLLLLITPTAAFAQSSATPAEHQQAITLNPFLTLAGWFNAEYERRIGPTTTWGLSGSLAEFDDFEYRSANLLFRYYPEEDALSGFFLGGRTGVYHLEDQTDSAVFFGVSVDLGYNWLLGSERRFAISLGAGLSRLFGGDLEDAQLTIPLVRLVNIGVAF